MKKGTEGGIRILIVDEVQKIRESLARIKQAFPHIVIIGLSIDATKETRQVMRAAGATTVISKDMAVEQLHDEIVEVVNQRSTAFH